MKAFLIKPDHAQRRISIQAINVVDTNSILDNLGKEVYAINTVRPRRNKDNPLSGHVGYVDDNGFAKQPVGAIRCHSLYVGPLAGNMVLLGENHDGEISDAEVSREILEALFSGSYTTDF